MRGRIAETTTWAGALAVLYLSLLDTVSAAELVVAAGAGAAVGWLAGAGRAAENERYAARRRWLEWLVRLPPTLVADVGRVVIGLAGARRTTVGVVEDFHLSRISPRHAAETRRALATVAIGLTPASYVITFAPDPRDRLLVHRMRRGASAYERRIAS